MEREVYTVTWQQYAAQQQQAQQQMDALHQFLLAQGYTQTAPGVLSSPDGSITVED